MIWWSYICPKNWFRQGTEKSSNWRQERSHDRRLSVFNFVLCGFSSKTLNQWHHTFDHICLGKKRSTKSVPPNPTNQQCARALEDWNDPEGADKRQRQKKKSDDDNSESNGERSARSGFNGEQGSRSRSKQPRSKSCAPSENAKAPTPRHRFGCPRIEAHIIWKKL